MELLDFFLGLNEMEFNQIAPNAFFSIWRKDLEERKLNAILSLPPNVQERLMEDFKFRRTKIENLERVLTDLQTKSEKIYLDTPEDKKDDMYYFNLGTSMGIGMTLIKLKAIK